MHDKSCGEALTITEDKIVTTLNRKGAVTGAGRWIGLRQWHKSGRTKVMDKRIRVDLIADSYGCDNCRHLDDGRWDDYCRICDPDYYPPSKYRPALRSIHEKVYYNELERVSYQEYLRFLKGEK